MKNVIVGALTLAALAGSANAALTSETLVGQARGVSYDIRTGTQGFTNTVRVPGDTYENTAGLTAASGGFTSTALNSTWGDSITTAQTGVLDTLAVSVFNSASGGNTGQLNNFDLNISISRASDNSLIGSFTSSFVGVALPAGFFTYLTVTGISVLSLNLDTTDLIITQQLSSIVGGSTRAGIVFTNNNPTVGSTTPGFFINSTTVGPAGFYTLNAPNANASATYQLGVIPAPASAGLLGLGGLLAARRRRA